MNEEFDNARINWLREKASEAESIIQQLVGLDLFIQAHARTPEPETEKQITEIKESLIPRIQAIGGLDKLDEILKATGHRVTRVMQIDWSWLPENLRHKKE